MIQVRLTFFLNVRYRPLHRFSHWTSFGFAVGRLFDFRVYFKHYKRVIAWQETVMDYLREDEDGLSWDEEI